MVSHNRLMLPTSSLCLEQCRIYAKTPTSTTYGRICRFRCPFPRDSGQHSSKPIDKVALPLQQHGYCRSGNVVFPIYDPSTPVSVAWGHLISSINTAKMERADLEDMPPDKLNVQRPVTQTPTIQLLYLFPIPRDITGSQAGPEYSNTLIFV